MHAQSASNPGRDDERITAEPRFRHAREVPGVRVGHGHRQSAIVSLLGILSLTDSLAGIACLLLGPLTCFLTWALGYYILLIGLPIHLLAVLAATGGPQVPPEGLMGRGFALAAGLLGTALSGGVLWIVRGLLGMPL